MEASSFSRRAFLKLLSAASTGIFLTACAPSQTPSEPTSDELTVDLPQAEPVKIRYWLPPTTEQTYREARVNAFMEMHPNIIVEMDGADPSSYNEATQLLFKGGDSPDIFWKYSLSLPQMLAQDMIRPYPLDVQDYLQSAYPPSMFIEGINMWEGKLYGFWPVGSKSATRVLYCNDALFAKADLKPPATWGELRETALALTNVGGEDVYGLIIGGKSPWDYTALVGGLAMSAMKTGSAGGEEFCIDWTTAELTIDHDAMASAVELCVQLLDDGSLFPGFSTISHTEARAGLANNWAAMYLGGWWDAGAYNTQFPDFSYTVAPPPIEDGGKQGHNHGNSFIERVYIAKDAQNLDAVTEFLLFKFGPEYQIGWAKNGWFTTLPEANTPENITDPQVLEIFRTADDVRTIPDPVARNAAQAEVNAERKGINPNWGEILTGVFTGQISPTAYVQEAANYSVLWREELIRSIDELAGRDMGVTLDDWIFSDWNPDENYTG